MITTASKPIPPEVLLERLCAERGITIKRRSFCDRKAKRRHDDIEFSAELAKINKEFGGERD